MFILFNVAVVLLLTLLVSGAVVQCWGCFVHGLSGYYSVGIYLITDSDMPILPSKLFIKSYIHFLNIGKRSHLRQKVLGIAKLLLSQQP
jgi:hypothetical protein